MGIQIMIFVKPLQKGSIIHATGREQKNRFELLQEQSEEPKSYIDRKHRVRCGAAR